MGDVRLTKVLALQQGLFLGVDVGGTAIKAGLLDGRSMTRRAECETPHDFEAFVQAVGSLVERLTPEAPAAGLGIGIPGVMDHEQGLILDAPNLEFLVQRPTVRTLQERLGIPVSLENDASLAALGEARFGAGAGHDHFLLATIGTGIGGGLFLDGELFRGPGGMAGEFGHLPVAHDRICGCGARGCLEAAVSARAMTEMAREDGLKVLDLRELAEKARIGEERAVRVFNRAGAYLGEAFSQVALLLDVRVFLLGGGGAPVLDLLRNQALSVLAMRAFGRDASDFRIERASLGNDAGVMGAAALASARFPQE